VKPLNDPHALAELNVFLGIWRSKEEYGKWKTRLLTRLDSVLETNELFILDSYKEPDDPNIRILAHIEQELEQAVPRVNQIGPSLVASGSSRTSGYG